MGALYESGRAPSPLSTSRTRRPFPGSNPPPDDDAAGPPPKKRKLCDPTSPPPGVMDGLSTTPLTSKALREFNRRSTQLERENVARCELPPRRDYGLRARRAIANESEQVDSADRFLQQCSSQCLSRVKKFATHGGPDLRHLRGCQTLPVAEKRMNESTSSSLGSLKRKQGSESAKNSVTTTTTTTKSKRVDGPAFKQHLIEHGIYPLGYQCPGGRTLTSPRNLDAITKVLHTHRRSLSPSQFSEAKFELFEAAHNRARNEREIVHDVLPFIEGDAPSKECRAREVQYSNLKPVTDGTYPAPKPDFYDGALSQQLERNILEELSGLVVPSRQDDYPIAPNFFMEAKGPEGNQSVADRQIYYDLAAGERAQAALLAYQQSSSDQRSLAHTLGFTYVGGMLKLIAAHINQPLRPGSRLEYVMTKVKAWAMISDSDTFRKGATAYRNARDWAERQRSEAIQQANERAKNQALAVVHHEHDLETGVSDEPSAAETSRKTSQATTAASEYTATSSPNSDRSVDERPLGLEPPLNERSKGPRNGSSTSPRYLRSRL